MDENEVGLIGMPESNGAGDNFSSAPLEEFLAQYAEVNHWPIREDLMVAALMLHYSAGKKGYKDSTIEKLG